jgi:choline dehydrogenase-like flavoprotein
LFIDSLDLDDGSVIDCDIAIIGAGMAGICLAREFADSSLSICVLESGGEKPDKLTNSLNSGIATVYGPDGSEKSIDHYLHESRERYFGGTGNAWGGKCAYFDKHDFAERSWINHSGWPISFEDMGPFYDRACRLLRIPTLVGMQTGASQAVEHLNSQRNFSTSLRCFSGLTGEPMSDAFYDYKYGLSSLSNVAVYLHANIAALHLSKEFGLIETAEVCCLNNKRHTVKAKHFILASGGIENVRILLNSKGYKSDGIGNQHDLVGRFFNGHGLFRYLSGLNQPPCELRLMNEDLDLALYTDKDPSKTQGIFNLTQKAQWRERVSQFSATLTHDSSKPIDSDHKSENLNAFFMIEQSPNPESRISLSDNTDAVGVRTVALEWRFSKNDMKTLERGIELFAKDMKKSQFAELFNSKLEAGMAGIIESSRHHMGGTRMSRSAETGVVDENSMVHGVANLFVAGSSVFPTGGIANPTLTILALSIKLADHVKGLYVH